MSKIHCKIFVHSNVIPYICGIVKVKLNSIVTLVLTIVTLVLTIVTLLLTIITHINNLTFVLTIVTLVLTI